jgi:hypothetical protein
MLHKELKKLKLSLSLFSVILKLILPVYEIRIAITTMIC